MSDRRDDDPRVQQEGQVQAEHDPDQEPPFRDEFDVKADAPEPSRQSVGSPGQ